MQFSTNLASYSKNFSRPTTSGLIAFACHFRIFAISQVLIVGGDGCDGGGREPLSGRLSSHIDVAKYL